MQLLKNAVLCSAVLLTSSWALAGWGANSALAAVGGGLSLSAKSDTGTSKPRKARKSGAAKPSKGGTVTFYNGSEETASDRDRRLKRECKGRSNSGLCEGYTR
jgi:hypothetical protein